MLPRNQLGLAIIANQPAVIEMIVNFSYYSVWNDCTAPNLWHFSQQNI